jgi:hypothetical protein
VRKLSEHCTASALRQREWRKNHPNYKPKKHNHGCARKGKRTTEYYSWQSMRNRCTCPSRPSWHRYGGRGIKVCERWNDFKNFLADMGPKPTTEKYTLERIDNDGNYEPGNCKWATMKEQSNNTAGRVYVHTPNRRAWCLELAKIGQAFNASLSPEQRSEIRRKAWAARQGKK